MPDLAVHLCAGILGSKFIRDPAGRALFVAGNCLPDLAQKTLALGFASPIDFAEATHTPAGILCLAYAASMLFEEGWRRRAFRLLALGSLLHILMDTAKDCLGCGVIDWGFPFSLHRVEFGLYPVEESPTLLLPWALGAVLLVEMIGALRRRRPL